MGSSWTPDDWTRLDGLFAQALELGSEERAALLAEVRADDPTLADELTRLLASDESEWPLDSGSGIEIGGLAVAALTEREHNRSPDAADTPGSGRYRLLKRIGRGGMATVYLAEQKDGRVERNVAVKVLRKGIDTEDVLAHFLSERQILATLNHPNIAQMLDAGETPDGRPFLVMEYVEGRSLSDHLADADLSLTARLRLFRTICAAVEHAHSHLIVHRDLKPSNVLVRTDGVVKLLDFGIAKLLDPKPGQPGDARTRTGVRLLTPRYASPEQMLGAPVTTATDVYQLGCLLYVLIAGEPPVRSHDIRSVVEVGDPPAPSALARAHAAGTRIPRDLDAIALRAVSRDPGARYRSAHELAQEIDRFMEGRPVRARAPTAMYRAARFVRRHRWAVSAAVLALLGLGWHLRTLRLHAAEVELERDRAQTQANTAQEVAQVLSGIFGQVNPGIERGDTLSARTLLERAVLQLSANSDADPEVRGAVLEAVAEAHARLGLHADALPLLEEVKASRAELRVDDPDRIRNFEQIASAYQQAGNIEAARQSWGAAISGHRARLADSPNDLLARAGLAKALAALSFAGGMTGSDSSRAAAAGEAIAILEEQPTLEPVTLANARVVMAGVRDRSQDADGAEALLRSAVAGMEAAVAAGDVQAEPALASALNSLGLFLTRRTPGPEAVTMLERAVAQYEEALGPSHPTALRSLSNLVDASRQADDIGSWLAHAREWVDREASTPWSTPDRHVRALEALGRAHLAGGAPDSAAARFREAIRTADEHGLGTSREAFQVRFALANLLSVQGDLPGAERQLRAALGPENTPTQASTIVQAQARNLLADILEQTGRVTEAASQRELARSLEEATRSAVGRTSTRPGRATGRATGRGRSNGSAGGGSGPHQHVGVEI